jgi:predicted membrane protein
MDPSGDWREIRRQEREQRREKRRRRREEMRSWQREHWERLLLASKHLLKTLREMRSWQREHWERLGKEWPRAARGGHQLVGIVLIAVGGLFILSNLGFLHVEDIWEFWPVILIVIGLSNLAQWRARTFPTAGVLLTGVGTAFLLRNLGIIQVNVWRYIWPGLMITWGAALLFRHAAGCEPVRAAGGIPGSSANKLDEWVVFGGIERKIQSQEFEGGHAFAAFGGIELDLRDAGTKKEEIAIEASAMFGGVEIRVPDAWDVTVNGTGIFGGYSDGTSPRVGATEKRPRLVVTGTAIFGGVEVRN